MQGGTPSDRGVQYRALRYAQTLDEADAITSVGTKGDSFDNAMAEALNLPYTAELIFLDGPGAGREDVEAAPTHGNPTVIPD